LLSFGQILKANSTNFSSGDRDSSPWKSPCIRVLTPYSQYAVRLPISSATSFNAILNRHGILGDHF
jgi:hypothetical protein